MKISIVVFDEFTDLDLFLMWDLLNRVPLPDWEVRIVGERSTHLSAAGIHVPTQGRIEEANDSDVVLFVSGRGTRVKMKEPAWLSRFRLDPARQMIGSICSGSLLMASLRLLDGKTATTYPTTKIALEDLGVTVEEKPFIAHGNIATAGGCLAAQYLVRWVIERKAGAEWSDLVLRSIQPVGEGLRFADAPEVAKLYSPALAGTR